MDKNSVSKSSQKIKGFCARRKMVTLICSDVKIREFSLACAKVENIRALLRIISEYVPSMSFTHPTNFQAFTRNISIRNVGLIIVVIDHLK